MSCYYLDTSALVKRYVDEAGSDWFRATISDGHVPLLFTSRVTIVEMVSAFARRMREGALAAEELAIARDALRSDFLGKYRIMPPSIAILEQACAPLEQHPLRAFDATHLASALEAQRFLTTGGYPPLTLLSADERLNRAADAEGLAVDKPNDHP